MYMSKKFLSELDFKQVRFYKYIYHYKYILILGFSLSFVRILS